MTDDTKEEFVRGDGTEFFVKRTWDMQPNTDSAAALRSAGMVGSKDNWHVGRVDKRMLDLWLKEAGVAWDDHGAVQEVMKRKLLSGEFSALRVHEGKF